MPTGVRLLPPRDPYTQLRDRGTILDPAHHRDVWRAIGQPGTVLAGGDIVGIWRPHRSGRGLTIAVTAYGSRSDRAEEAIREEAAQIAALRGATTVNVTYDTC